MNAQRLICSSALLLMSLSVAAQPNLKVADPDNHAIQAGLPQAGTGSDINRSFATEGTAKDSAAPDDIHVARAYS